jgi:hypothetical protein
MKYATERILSGFGKIMRLGAKTALSGLIYAFRRKFLLASPSARSHPHSRLNHRLQLQPALFQHGRFGCDVVQVPAQFGQFAAGFAAFG